MKELSPFDHLLARFGLGAQSDLYLEIVQATRAGHLCIDWDVDPDDERLVFRDGKLYLKAMDALEDKICTGLINQADQQVAAVDAVADSRLNREQKSAFERVLSQPLTLITGGPGTGKSFTIEALVDAFAQSRVLVAAPTGKAAMQLEARLDNSHATFSTLHRALGAGLPYALVLDYDLVIIDEASMIDAQIWAALFDSIMPNTRLVIVGDPNQLPPVECGHLFAEIVDLLPEHVVELRECLRTDRQELIDLGASILKGEMPADEFFVDDPAIFEMYARSYESPAEAQHQRVILCPLRRGSSGVNAINDRLAAGHVGRYVPILLRKNHADLVNGEMGSGYLGPEGLESTYFHGELYEGLDVELAFCQSVHKAQGSEFESVLLSFPKGSECFGRAALYTAVTRAKASIQFFGEKETVAAALKAEFVRGSGLKSRFARARQRPLAANERDGTALPRSFVKGGVTS